MQKTEFIEQVAKHAGVTRSEADKVVRAFMSVIEEALANGDKITLTGFGTFEVRQRSEREVTHIRTKEKVKVPASKTPAFSAGAILKQAINNTGTGRTRNATSTRKEGGRARATSEGSQNQS